MIRVLIADDQASVRRSLTALLERDGDIHVIAEASNGHEAVRQRRRLHQPDERLLRPVRVPADGAGR